MATRITYQFKTFYGETYRVDIDDSAYVGSALEVDVAPDGFTLSYEGEGDTVLPGIMGSKVSVSIAVTPENRAAIETLRDDIKAGDEEQFTIAIYKITAGPTVALYWCGYVLFDLGGFDDVGDVFFYSLKAVDGIGRLKDVDYSNAGDPYADATTILAHLNNCLTAIGTEALYWDAGDIFLRTVVNWVDENMPAPTAAVDPLAYSRISGQAFATRAKKGDGEDWDFMSMYEVLETLCTSFNARLMLSRGCWRFEQIRERTEENFYERRWSSALTLISSTAAAGYDKPIIQVSEDNRLNGGIFNYLPALQRVTVEYDHKTYKNYVENLAFKWYKDSTANTPLAITGIAFDSDTYLRVSGVLNIDVSVSSYTKPWRYLFGIEVELTPDGAKIRSESKPVSSGGIPIPTTNQTTPEWIVAGVYYEISTPWIFSANFKGQVPFAFWTPYVPTGQDGINIDFSQNLGGEDYAENSVTATLNDWRFADLVLNIYGSDAAANFEVKRNYRAETALGNSDTKALKTIFGHPVHPWTVPKIRTTDDLSTWLDTTASWDRGSETLNKEFGDLLAIKTLQLQGTPIEVYNGTLKGDATYAHSRIVFPDDSTWLMLRGTFTAQANEWNGEWAKTGVADAPEIDSTTPVGAPIEDLPNGAGQPGLVVAPGSGTGTTTATGWEGNTAISVLTTNYVDTVIPTGTVTSIPVDYPIRGGVYHAGDIIYLVDPQSGQMFPFVVDADGQAGDTSISVTSTRTTADIPIGALVVYSPFNIYTTQGGDTGGSLPIGTAPGQILKWNDTDEVWEPYSGTTDGYVLTWDTTNGWQEEASAGGSTIYTADGTIGTGRVATLTDTLTFSGDVADTSTAANRLIIITNSTGTPLAGFGGQLLFQGESSTTVARDMIAIAAAWSTATDASRKANMIFKLANSSALSEYMRLTIASDTTGEIWLGSSSPVVLSRSKLETAQNFTVGGSSYSLDLGASSGAISMYSTANSASSVRISNTSNASSSVGGVTIGPTVTLTQTSGTRSYLLHTAGFAPTSGTAVHNSFAFTGTFNQTGGANGITRGIYLNQVLTAVHDMRLLEIAANGANTKGVYQTGATVVNNFVGATAFGTTSTPDASAQVDIVSTTKGLGLPVMTTTERDAISSPRDGLVIYNTTTDKFTVRENGAWVEMGTGGGTVTGTGTSGQLAYWNSSSGITGEAALNYDATNNRIGINKTSPAHTLSIQTASETDGVRIESDGTLDQDVWGIELAGTATGPYVQRGRISLDVFSNAGASSVGQAILFKVATDTVGTYTPVSIYQTQLVLNHAGNFTLQGIGTGNRIRIETAGGVFSTTTWVLTNPSYTTNDTTARLKLVGIGTTSGNYSLKIHDGANAAYFYASDDKRIGILTASPAVSLDVTGATDSIALPGGTTAQRPAVNNSVRWNSTVGGFEGRGSGVWYRLTSNLTPTISAGAAAGTSPGTPTVFGNDLGGQISITTGTSCTTGPLLTVTFNKALDAGAVITVMLTPRNSISAQHYGRYYISTSGNTSFTISAGSALDDSTDYVFNYSINQ